MQLEQLIGEMEGASVVGTATDGAAAVQVVSQTRPDLVLMDIVMPKMDGLSALRLLRAKHPELRVAMVSSVGGAQSRAEEAFRLGAVQVIGKPFDREHLEALIESELRLKRSPGGGHP